MIKGGKDGYVGDVYIVCGAIASLCSGDKENFGGLNTIFFKIF